MCGIGGVIELPGSRQPHSERLRQLKRMLALLAHRGPDEAGLMLDRHVALCATRLKINDLVHGQQPFTEETKRFWLVYNGEIYNHIELRRELESRGYRFLTHCDTEVVLKAWQAWGVEAPEHFEGGFALAMYDRRERTVALVRDRFGKRPLFYRQDHGRILFASEMKAFSAFLDHTFRWDISRLASLFTHWTLMGAETPFQGIKQVPPGTILEVSDQELRQRRYTNDPLSAQPNDETFNGAAEHAFELLERSIAIRLRSDVDVGIQLSGGLDSTILTHLVRMQRTDRLQSFSVAFDDPEFDESSAQNVVAREYGLSHHRLAVTSADIAESFPRALWHAEIPQFRTAFVPMFLLSHRIRECGIKVVLSGEGADEVYFGYDLFKETQLRDSWSSLSTQKRRDAIRRLYPYLPLFSEENVSALEALLARSVMAKPDRTFSHALRFDHGRFAVRLLQDFSDHSDSFDEALSHVPGFDELPVQRRAQWIEFHTLLQGYLLSSQGDRMLFAHGVESRCPFLSPPVVAHAASLPVEYHLSSDGVEKRLLKHAFGASVPREVLSRPKQPYRAPGVACFFDRELGKQGRFLDWVEERLAPDVLDDIAPLHGEHALRFVDKIRQTPPARISAREEQAFFLLLSLSILDRQYVHGGGQELVGGMPPLCISVDLASDVISVEGQQGSQ